MEANSITPRCPIRTTLELLGGKWRLLIIHRIGPDGAVRYGELRRAIPEISEKVLTQELKALATHHFVERIDYEETPARVAYRLTENGHRALELAAAMRRFAAGYRTP